LKLLDRYKEEGKRVLVFSQFTQVLDILKSIFGHKQIKYLVLTGGTAVDERQGLVDTFNEDESIPVFLLSTKAGGMGINLTAASVVIIFDQDFNPHNDKQAMDRCYRIGQKRNVEVIKLLTRETIEEDIHRIGTTKLALDDAVAGQEGEDDGERAEKVMKSSLINVLRTKMDEEDKAAVNGTGNDPATVFASSADELQVPGGTTPASSTAGSSAIPIIIDDNESEALRDPDLKPSKSSEVVQVY